MSHMVIQLLKILFGILSIYFWILIPCIKILAQPIIGRDSAGSLALSLMAFHRMGVFYMDNVPLGLLNRIFYTISDASELIAFLGSAVLIWATKRKMPFVIVSSVGCVLTSLATAVYIRGGLFSATFPALAVVSGLTVAVVFRSVPLSSTTK